MNGKKGNQRISLKKSHIGPVLAHRKIYNVLLLLLFVYFYGTKDGECHCRDTIRRTPF